MIVMATGWTWDYIYDTMTFPRLQAFSTLWDVTPPPYVSLARLSSMMMGYFGITLDRPASDEPKGDFSFLELPDSEFDE